MALARAFAATLLCEHPVEENGRIEPCGVCPSCIRDAADSHADIQVFTQDRLPAQDRGKLTVGIKLIRLLTADVQIKPYEGGRKVYILPDADKLTTEAQNALLKTLEEPPSYAVLILIARGTEAFLPTILSRCVTLRFHPLQREELASWLQENMEISVEQALLAAGLSGGNPGMAQAMVSSEAYQALYEQSMQVLEGLEKQTAYDIVSFTTSLASEDKAADMPVKQADAFLDLVQFAVRDIMVVKSTGQTDGLILRDRIPYSRSIAARLSYQALQQMQEEIMAARLKRSVASKDEQILEMLLLNMRGLLR